MPERFDLTYVGPDGEKHRPVIIHRVIFGSIERFIAILTEHLPGFSGLATGQVKLLSITDRSNEYISSLLEDFKKAA